jgi:hypothetical protein
MRDFIAGQPHGAFSQVATLASLPLYRSELLSLTLMVNRKLTDIAQYDPDRRAIFFAADPRNTEPSREWAVGETVWHETTHAIEDSNGDIGYVANALYDERNVDYMGRIAKNALPWLAAMEKAAIKGASSEVLAPYWTKFLKEVDGAATMPSTAAYPVDLATLKSWFGFSVDPQAIKDFYLSGAFLPGKEGDALRAALAPPDPIVGDWSFQGGVIHVTGSDGSYTGVVTQATTFANGCSHSIGRRVWSINGTGGSYSGTHLGFQSPNCSDLSLAATWSLTDQGGGNYSLRLCASVGCATLQKLV